MPFWKADEPATRWRRLERHTRDALGTVADDTRGLAATAGHEVRGRAAGAGSHALDVGRSVSDKARSGVAEKLVTAAGAVEPSRRRGPRPAVLVAVLAGVAVVVWLARNLKGSAAGDDATDVDEPAPTTATSSAGAKANGTTPAAAQKGRAAS